MIFWGPGRGNGMTKVTLKITDRSHSKTELLWLLIQTSVFSSFPHVLNVLYSCVQFRKTQYSFTAYNEARSLSDLTRALYFCLLPKGLLRSWWAVGLGTYKKHYINLRSFNMTTVCQQFPFQESVEAVGPAGALLQWPVLQMHPKWFLGCL